MPPSPSPANTRDLALLVYGATGFTGCVRVRVDLGVWAGGVGRPINQPTDRSMHAASATVFATSSLSFTPRTPAHPHSPKPTSVQTTTPQQVRL